MVNFGEIEVYTGHEEQEKNTDVMVQTAQAIPAVNLISVEQTRSMAEVQAAMIVARANPRNEYKAYEKILAACSRLSLAERAIYAYKRGSSLITGPSIRLMETIARIWGNITYGLRELTRTQGESTIEAFAWDLESNVRVVRHFQIRHLRDKTDGVMELKSERDIYELIANQGQRRVRSCLQELIPSDIIEAAEAKGNKTMTQGGGVPIEDRVRNMVSAFSGLGVTSEMVSNYLGHSLEVTIPTELVKMTQIYNSIKGGLAQREDFFSITPGAKTVTEEETIPDVVEEREKKAKK
jgi:shikimate kinase